MSPMLTKRFSQVLTWAMAAVLSCPAVFAQQSNQEPTQTGTVPALSDRSQLPGGPVPNKASFSLQTSDIEQPNSSSAAPLASISTDPKTQVTVLEDTLIRVMTNVPLSSRQTRAGSPLLFTLSQDVVVDDVLIIPRGATVHGTVVESKQAGALTGSPDLILKLVSLDLGGRSYPLYTYQFKVVGASKTKPTETKVKGGVLIGAIVGGVFSGSARGGPSAVGKLTGMGTGAVLGAGAATAVAAAIPGPILSIPAESQMDFYLASPTSVLPVTAKEAARLGQRLRPGGPALYVRGDTP